MAQGWPDHTKGEVTLILVQDNFGRETRRYTFVSNKDLSEECSYQCYLYVIIESDR